MNKLKINRSLPPRTIMLLSFAATSVINYIFGIAIGWILVPGDFGLVGFSQTIILIAGLLLNSGLAWSLTAQVSDADMNTRMSITRGALIANIVLAGLLIGLTVGLFVIGVLKSGLETWTIVWAVVASFPFISIIAVTKGAVRGAEAFGSLALITVTEVFFKAIGGIFLSYIGWGAFGALLGFTIGSFIASFVGIWRIIAVFAEAVWGRISFPSWRLTGDLFIVLLGMALLLNLDILFVKSFAGDSREIAGFYQSAIMLANLPYYMATALLSVLFPQLARNPDIQASLAPVVDTLKFILLAFIPIDIGLAIAPEQVLATIFPSEFLVAAPLLRILAIGNIALIGSALLSTTFQATRHAKIPAIILVCATSAEFIALYIFVPIYQAPASAIIFSITCMVVLLTQLLTYIWIVKEIDWKLASQWMLKYGIALALTIALYFLLMSLSDIFLLSSITSALVYLIIVIAMKIMPLPSFISSRKRKAV